MRLRDALRIKELEKAKADELNHSKLQFFTNITHELLTPLTIISATMDELKMKSPGHGELYQTMTQNINRLIRLLQQILEFRKAETGNLQLKVAKGDLAAFTRNSMENFRPLIKKKQLHFSLIAHPEILPAYFDFDKMDKILYNLLSNAAKYNEEGGTIWIELIRNEEKKVVILSVKDNGKGIDKEALSTLFTRFYEGDHRRFKTIGTGIGLSLTRDLVQLHNGTITVKSEPEKGTTFRVEIPYSRQAYREEQIDDTLVFGTLPVETEPEITGEALEGSEENEKSSLLILEDNEELIELMVKLLNREYRVYTAENGKEGLRIIREQEIDLVVSDVMMPVMDGNQFCRELKASFDTCHIPVILLTAKTGKKTALKPTSQVQTAISPNLSA
ncbi:MAG: ATP-binding protein [Bacteroides sp.]|nr:ATP-binding protein [Bacteroides sp.]